MISRNNFRDKLQDFLRQETSSKQKLESEAKTM